MEQINEANLEQISQDILNRVNEICCFGSSNKGIGYRSNAQFQIILKNISKLLYEYNSIILKSFYKNKILEEEAVFDLVKNAVETYWIFPSTATFKKGERYKHLPPNLMIREEKNIIHMINNIYRDKISLWDEDCLKGLEASIAKYLSDYHLTQKILEQGYDNLLIENQTRFTEETIFKLYYDKGTEPIVTDHRNIFLKETIRSVRTSSLLYGYGNCGLMADIAFIDAIYKEVPCDLTYIRFINTQKRIEETNAIALGNWPKPGCKIICPWQGEKGKHYLWNGSMENTPEAVTVNGYNEVKVLFKAIPEERVKIKKLLDATDYKNWLNDSKRNKNIAEIKDISDKFRKRLAECELVKQPIQENNNSMTMSM